MKINYDMVFRNRSDSIKIIMNIEEEAEPISVRGIKYQPTVLTVEFGREIRRSTHSRDRDQYDWDMSWSVEGNRILKSGGLGQQARHLWFFRGDEPSWLADATKLAKERFDEIISDWPDRQWPSEESLQSP